MHSLIALALLLCSAAQAQEPVVATLKGGVWSAIAPWAQEHGDTLEEFKDTHRVYHYLDGGATDCRSWVVGGDIVIGTPPEVSQFVDPSNCDEEPPPPPGEVNSTFNSPEYSFTYPKTFTSAVPITDAQLNLMKYSFDPDDTEALAVARDNTYTVRVTLRQTIPAKEVTMTVEED